MKKLILTINILFFAQLSFSQDLKFSTIGISKEMMQSANVILREYKETFTIEDIGKATHKIYKIYTILNKEGESYAQLSAYEDKFNSIKTFEGKMYDALGRQVDKLKKSEIKEEHYTDYLTLAHDDYIKVGRFNRGEYPYTVEFTLESNQTSTMFYPSFQPQEDENMAIEKAAFEISAPKNLKFRYKEINMPAKSMKSIEAGNTISYQWELNNILPAKREKFSPSFEEQCSSVHFAPNEFSIDKYKGNMNSWEEYGKFQSILNTDRDKLPEETQNQILSITKTCKSKFEKITAIYNYMQSKTRYVSIQLGVGGWQPIAADVVDKKGYGDCKALSNYMKAMLKVAGIESYYTKVKAGENEKYFMKDFPSVQFNHIILCVPNEKDTTWLECTSQNQSAGYLGNFTDDRYVLIVTPQGGKLVKTPHYTQKNNQLIRTAQVNIEPDGTASVQAKTIFTGLQQDKNNMDYYVEGPKETQRKFLAENVKISHYDLIDFKYERKKDKIPSVIETVNVKINGFGSKSGKRIFIAPNLMNKFEFSLPENQERKSEIVFTSADFIDIDTIKYKLPDNFHLEGALNDISFKSVFGEYSSNVKVEQGMITYVRKFSGKSGRFPKEKYKEIYDFFRNVNKSDKMKIVLVNNT